VKKAVKLFILFCFSAIIMSGCGKSDTTVQTSDHIVTRVDVLCQQEHVRIQRHYTDNKKMESVLLYLRLLKPNGTPDTDPDRLGKDIYEITVHLVGGKKRVYRQTGHRYFSVDFSPWKTIDPGKAHSLYALLRQLPGDLPVSQKKPEFRIAVYSPQLFAKSTAPCGYSLCTKCGNFN